LANVSPYKAQNLLVCHINNGTDTFQMLTPRINSIRSGSRKLQTVRGWAANTQAAQSESQN
jgi:hypothetical protein